MIGAPDTRHPRLHDTFAALCARASPFRAERAVADDVIAALRALGLEVEEDGAGAALDGDSGNLLARLPGRGGDAGPWLLLCAHLDTVVPQAAIEPVLVDGGWENAHAGILGADNKAAVAVMLEALRHHAERHQPPPIGLELLLTVSEEDALAGAKQFDAGRLRAGYGYVFDHATPIGEVIVASPTYFRIAAEFRGVAAHAGINPEDGRSAIRAAAHAVCLMPHGRLDDETTANVGNIAGGVASTNVVAERCTLLAEARSLRRDKVEATVARIVDALHDGANHAECDLDLLCEELFTGYRVKPSARSVAIAEAALRRCGYEPRRVASGGASDANVLRLAGIDCVNLANGTERPHEPGERVGVAQLDAMLDVCLAAIDEAGRSAA